MNVQRGDVMLVDYPYAAGGGTKVRPVLVIQNDRDNQRQVKSVRGFNYVFFRKECFELRENLYAAIVILDEGDPPKLFLIPATAWQAPSSLFVSHDYEPPRKSKPEWGLGLSAKSYPLLQEYAFEKVVAKL